MTIDPPDRSNFEVKVERETAPEHDSGELSLELEVEWDEGATDERGDLTVE